MKFGMSESGDGKSSLYNFFHSISFIAKNTRGVFVLEILFFTVSGLLPPLNVAAVSMIISGAEDLMGGAAFLDYVRYELTGVGTATVAGETTRKEI